MQNIKAVLQNCRRW